MPRSLAPLSLLLALACDPTGSVKLGDDSAAPASCTFYVDGDGDGYGDEATYVEALCDEGPEGTVTTGGDCDDAAPEINPGADELCDGVDNDCSGQADDNALDAGTWYVDGDGDGYGDEASAVVQCVQPSGTIALGGDCDDTDTRYNPGAVEDDCADPADYNCDGSTGYDDLDGDGWAACEECDDGDAAINPDAVEVCDGADNDCDALIDDADDSLDAGTTSTFYVDADADGYGDAANTVAACAAPEGAVSDDSDCDDARAEVNPGAAEVCDGLDNDCDALIDDADDSLDLATTTTWYGDGDGDGYGAEGDSVDACVVPSGYGAGSDDCDDGDAGVNPGAAEACDAADQDCDGSVDEGFTDTDADAVADCVDVCPVYADPAQAANGDGSQTSPYMSINDAIALRGEYCDEILLLPGTYNETVDYDGVDLSIASTDGAEATIVDGGGAGAVFTFDDGETAAATLTGVTITGGTGNAGNNDRLTNATSYRFASNADHGGGVFIEGASPTISECIIENNTVDGYGGGVVGYEYDGLFTDNVVRDNEAEYEQFGGGGLWLYNSDATVTGNTFEGNSASGSSGDGGGLHVLNGSPTILANRFEANEATNYGDGLRFYYSGGLVANNLIVNHTGGQGVAVMEASAIGFINNTLDGNYDGLFVDGGSGYYYNNLITNSVDDGFDAEYYTCLYSIAFDYNDVWGSGDDDYTSSSCGSYRYSYRFDNVSTDPGYTDRANGDWTLSASSAVADAGGDASSFGFSDDLAGTARPQGNAWSMGAYER